MKFLNSLIFSLGLRNLPLVQFHILQRKTTLSLACFLIPSLTMPNSQVTKVLLGTTKNWAKKSFCTFTSTCKVMMLVRFLTKGTIRHHWTMHNTVCNIHKKISLKINPVWVEMFFFTINKIKNDWNDNEYGDAGDIYSASWSFFNNLS